MLKERDREKNKNTENAQRKVPLNLFGSFSTMFTVICKQHIVAKLELFFKKWLLEREAGRIQNRWSLPHEKLNSGRNPVA